MKILILCTGNGCRSQMAHGFLQSFDKGLEVCSAGTNPALQVNRTAVAVMKETGIDISGHKPENVVKYTGDVWDYVMTVCDNANETCPVFIGKAIHRLHMGFENPSEFAGTNEEIINEFRRIRDQIRERFLSFYNENLK